MTNAGTQTAAHNASVRGARRSSSLISVVVRIVLAAPVAFFDLLDFLLREAEVVPDLVDQRLPDRDDEIVLVFARVFDRTLEERDLVGQAVAIGPLPLGQRRAF